MAACDQLLRIQGAKPGMALAEGRKLRRVLGREERAGDVDEAATGLVLFDRTARGYLVPEARRRIIEAAREVERAVGAVDRLIHGSRAPLAGEIRVTSTDSLCLLLLPAILADLARSAPDLKIELLSTNRQLDLGRAHAEITIRPALGLPEDLAGVRAATMTFRAYAARGAAPELWLGLAGPLRRSAPEQWLDASVAPERIVRRADSFVILRELAASGQGRAILPTFLGAADPRLCELPGVFPELAVPVWVACHADFVEVPRIAELRTTLAAAVARHADLLAPGPGASG